MKWAALVGVLLLAAGGCLKTYHYESTQVVNAGVCSDGSCTVNSRSEGSAQQWCGPGLPPPRQVQP
jgi:hypothetical protein